MPKSGKQTRPGEITTGIVTWLKTGRINPSVKGFRRIQRYLKEIEKGLIADLGGPDKMTTAQEILVRSVIQAYGVLLLASAYTQRYSILKPDQARKGILELQPCLSHQFIAFMNSIRQNLALLGIQRKEIEEPLDLKTYVETKYGKDEEKKAGQGEET